MQPIKNKENDNKLKRDQVITKYKILLIDDQEAIKYELQAALPQEKYDAIFISQSDFLDDHFKNGYVPDIIVLDVYMPYEGKLEAGLRIADKLRNRLPLPEMRQRLRMLEVPIIIYSNYAYWIDEAKTMDLKTEREREYEHLRKEFEKYSVYTFIDKNMTKEGEVNLNSIRTLKIKIDEIISSLEGKT